MKPHIHIGDSRIAYVPGHRNQALLCRCGAWLMPGGGEWRAVPEDLLSPEMLFGTRLLRFTRWLRSMAIAFAIGLLLALWLVPGVLQ